MALLQAIVLALQLASVLGIHITSDPSEVVNKTFAYVIVGGGTAGLTVASRLAEDPTVSVLVIEAGPDAQNSSAINDPAQNIPVSAGVFSWAYNTTAQQVSGNVFTIPQGKVLGGSSSINGMCWTRGTIDQYNSIEQLGNPGWNFDSLLHYMKKAERFNLPTPAQRANESIAVIPSAHGFTGNVNAGYPQPIEGAVIIKKLNASIIDAIPSIAINPDIDSGVPNGVSTFKYSIKPGPPNSTGENIRSSSARSYVYPFLGTKTNLVILVGQQATRIQWAKGKAGTASGVLFIPTPAENATAVPESLVNANKEVIVASGAFGSPHFLELSGVGDPNILKAAGIDTVVPLPSVGTNLQDQSLAIFEYTVQPNVSLSDYTILNSPEALIVAFSDIDQILGDSAAASGAQLKASIPSRAATIVASGAFTSQQGLEKMLTAQAKSIVDFKAPVMELSFDGAQPPDIVNVTGSALWNLMPQWRGTVHVRSNNPSVRSAINPMYLTEQFDLDLMGNATRLVRSIFTSPPLQDTVAFEAVPGLQALPSNSTDAQWQAYVKANYQPVIHPIGSVPMLPKEDGGAVSSELLVYGTTNVRVVDSSVLPVQLSAHLSSTVYGIAEKAADIIKAGQT